jgi:O-antigen/teichoic acid export membrane protein
MTTVFLDVGIGLIGLVVVVAHDIAAILLGPDFRSGYMVMAPVLAAGVVYGASNIGHKSLEMGDLTRLMMADGMVAALANVGLNIVLVPRYGYLAAAYVTLATYLVYGGLIYVQSRRVVPWDIDLVHLLWAAGAAALGVFTATRLPTFRSPWLGLIMGAVAYAIPYAALLLLRWRVRLPSRR